MPSYVSSTETPYLAGLEAVRRRPGLYIGDPDERGLETCLFETLRPSISDFLAGFGDRINITLNQDGSVTVEDFGRGLEIEQDPKFGKPIVELRYSTLQYEYERYQQHQRTRPWIGPCGVGRACVNAVSERMRVDIRQTCGVRSIIFERGKTIQPLTLVDRGVDGNCAGITITFKPDPEIFRGVRFDFHSAAQRLEYTSCLNKGLFIHLSDLRPVAEKLHETESFFHPNGLVDFVHRRAHLHLYDRCAPIAFSKMDGDILIDAAIQFDQTENRQVLSFVNQEQTLGGGTHVDGFVLGLREAFQHLGNLESGWDRKDFRIGNLQRGIAAMIALEHPAPRFEGATKDKICNGELFETARRMTCNGILEFFQNNQDALSHALRHMQRRY